MFADRLIDGVRQFGPLCVGIDPHPDLIPPFFGPSGPDSACDWSLAILERCVGRVGVVKPQAGLFERWGAPGMAALEAVCRAARWAGLQVILDAKRGDIGSTAVGYAEGYLGAEAACPCDCLTVNPWMGIDTIEPFVVLAEREDKGVAVLARTSNPGAADFQARICDGEPLYIHVVKALAPMVARLRASTSGWSGLMLVAGATAPAEAAAIRAAAPDALFLVPGYGAQGAGAAAAVAGFVRRGSRLEGGVVNASRSVTCPDGAKSASALADWQGAVDRAIAAAQADLVAAVTC